MVTIPRGVYIARFKESQVYSAAQTTDRQIVDINMF